MKLSDYLVSSEYIDWQHSEIKSLACELSTGLIPHIEIAQSCYEYVRDQIKHSIDYQLSTAPVKASDVLKTGSGLCYAKSHLLAALLRANDVPAGLCYQRLNMSSESNPSATFCLHGLVAIYLEEFGWYRVDVRGNNSRLASEFCPPVEQLAFTVSSTGECDLPEIWAEPLPLVTQALEAHDTVAQVTAHLPDIPIIPKR